MTPAAHTPTSGTATRRAPRRSSSVGRSSGGRAQTRRTAAGGVSTHTAGRGGTISPRLSRAQDLAEQAVLVQVGAGLLARDSVLATVRDLSGRYRTRAAVERELARYERRGATARNRLERQVRRTRTKLERQVRQRRTAVGKLVVEAQDRIGALG